jgi:ketosteroid isomerase-like protein
MKPSPPKQIEKAPPVEIPKPEAKEKAGSLSKETGKSEPSRLPPVGPLPGVKPVISIPVAKPDRVETVKPEAREKITAEPKEAAKTAPSLSVRKTEPLAKVDPVVPAPPRKEETKPVLPQEPSAKVEVRVAPPLRPSPEEEEVRQFFARYIDRYARKDIDGFLSFFSAGAIQNKEDGMEGIRKIYTNFFNQSQELQYRLEDPKVEISQRGLVVKARYEVNQTLKKEGTKKTWRGQGQWFLMKEEGKLKVVSLDYQHD